MDIDGGGHSGSVIAATSRAELCGSRAGAQERRCSDSLLDLGGAVRACEPRVANAHGSRAEGGAAGAVQLAKLARLTCEAGRRWRSRRQRGRLSRRGTGHAAAGEVCTARRQWQRRPRSGAGGVPMQQPVTEARRQLTGSRDLSPNREDCGRHRHQTQRQRRSVAAWARWRAAAGPRYRAAASRASVRGRLTKAQGRRGCRKARWLRPAHGRGGSAAWVCCRPSDPPQARGADAVAAHAARP